MKQRRVVVIGAGIGGIAAAAHLARGGAHVTVVEKNPIPGGRCGNLSRLGHHFDTGPTLFIMPRVYESEFAALGTPLAEALDLIRVDPTYQLVFDDGSGLALSADLRLMESQLEKMEPGSFLRFLAYLEEGRRHYDLTMERLVNRDYRRASEFFTPSILPLLFRVRALAHHYDNMSGYFEAARLKAAFTFQDVYMGLSPFEAPATFSLLPYTELCHGVWYPRGGMYGIVKALVSLAQDAGVEFLFKTPAERIETKGSRASGVVLKDGKRLQADAILANADLPYVYEELLPQDANDGWQQRRFSCSVISFFWGVKKRYEALGPHTLFLADDYRGNFECIDRGKTLPGNASLYVHAPARLDPTMAPTGQDTLIAIVPVGHINANRDQDWPAIREEARRQVFRRLSMLGIDDLESNIKFEVCYDPSAWHTRYNLMKGATHGLCHNLTQLGYFRPHNRHSRYRNLYFAGASTHPGTGVPTAMVSGRLAARRLMEEWGA